MKNLKLILSGLTLIFGAELYAHEHCQDDLDSSSRYYIKTIDFVKAKKHEHALYSAKMFQVNAYEFQVVCNELEINKKHSYKEIVIRNIKYENLLYDQGLIKEKLLSKKISVK